LVRDSIERGSLIVLTGVGSGAAAALSATTASSAAA
jgi:hypothetical protein